jgi:hypothetical protein
MHIIDGQPYNAAVLSDSFTIRLKINGTGLRDFVLNYAYIFEVVEPEDIALPQRAGDAGAQPGQPAAPTPPEANAPAVCVIDSGIQEAHVLLQPAIDQGSSHCLLPGRNPNEVGDFVAPAGHGTRVAGAVLYGETVPKGGTPQLPFWIQNARVLDEQNRMPMELFPPAAVRAAVERFHAGPRHTRIFNHSINADGYSRSRYMSSWAAEIDSLCATYDVLIVQSSGNLRVSGNTPYLGMRDHLIAGRTYPTFLCEPSSRVANPGQSLQALTVGSIAYGALQSGAWQSFAAEIGNPSAFSRSGLAIWDIIKPEVVEYGGDAIRSGVADPIVQVGGQIPAACPELVRSTMHPPGPAYDRDQAGTSFAAPKVTRIAAQLQRLFPDEPALLYRALIVQSARWPTWAENILAQLRNQDVDPTARQQLFIEACRAIRCIGFGVPDETRATVNDDHRTTLITSGETRIQARECHIYQVPIPSEMRGQATEYDIRIEVTLSYAAQPRRTRRHIRRYLSTWVDWKSSRLREKITNFRVRAMKEEDEADAGALGEVIPWTLHEKSRDGLIRDVRDDQSHAMIIRGAKRNSGTVQKDWAVVKSNALPDHFCIAVVGHQGWSHDPDSTARYALAVTFEILGKEIAIYDPLRIAVQELQAEIAMETEAEVEISDEE